MDQLGDWMRKVYCWLFKRLRKWVCVRVRVFAPPLELPQLQTVAQRAKFSRKGSGCYTGAQADKWELYMGPLKLILLKATKRLAWPSLTPARLLDNHKKMLQYQHQHQCPLAVSFEVDTRPRDALTVIEDKPWLLFLLCRSPPLPCFHALTLAYDLFEVFRRGHRQGEGERERESERERERKREHNQRANFSQHLYTFKCFQFQNTYMRRLARFWI